MNRTIICPKCGTIRFYTNFEIQKVYFAFDANGNEADVALESEGIRSSVVNRCYYCGSKVKIKEADDEDNSH